LSDFNRDAHRPGHPGHRGHAGSSAGGVGARVRI